MHRATASVAAFGKLPTHGDFVRHRATESAVRAFDEWLQRGLFALKQQKPGAMREPYDAAPAQAFVFRDAETGQLLLGVVRASRDSAGRAFPFVVAAPAAEADASTHAILEQYTSFFQAAAAVADDVASGRVGHREVGALVDDLDRPRPSAPGSCSAYLRETTFREFGDAVWDYFEDSRKYVLFRHLTDTFGGEGERPSLRIGLRFPVDPGAPTQSAFFWLEVLRRVAPGWMEGGTCFWSVPSDGEGESEASLLVFPGTPPPGVFGEVLGLNSQSDRVWELQVAADGEQAALAALALPDRFGRVLEDEALTLQDVINQIAG